MARYTAYHFPSFRKEVKTALKPVWDDTKVQLIKPKANHCTVFAVSNNVLYSRDYYTYTENAKRCIALLDHLFKTGEWDEKYYFKLSGDPSYHSLNTVFAAENSNKAVEFLDRLRKQGYSNLGIDEVPRNNSAVAI
jgi:hypothetical protein